MDLIKKIDKRAATEDCIKNATLMDDWFMTEFFQDRIPETEEVLRTIPDDYDLKVEKVETQRPLQGIGHSLRLDVHAVDEYGGHHDIEIQRSSGGAGRKRARYHSSMMDATLLPKGEDFDVLPETHVIFITESDVLGANKPIYHIDRQIDETGEPFGDMAHIIYVNAANRDGTTKLGRLMQDFAEKTPEKMNSRVLGKRMSDLKEGEKMHLYELYVIQERELAEKRGEQNALRDLIKKLLEKGKTPEEIKDFLDIPLKDIMKIKNRNNN